MANKLQKFVSGVLEAGKSKIKALVDVVSGGVDLVSGRFGVW